MPRRKSIGLLAGAGVVGVALAATAYWTYQDVFEPAWNGNNISISQQRGDAITRALFDYHRDHGAFPQSLDALVPHYLTKLPKPTAGLPQWRYEAEEGAFRLQFSANSNEYPTSWTTSHTPATWRLDQ